MRFIIGADKRVVPFFVADGGGAAVAGNDQRVVRQRVEFAADVVEQGLVVAARKVGAADAFVKQYVAGN